MNLTKEETQLLRETIFDRQTRLREEYRLVMNMSPALTGDEIADKIDREIQALEAILVKLIC